MEILGIIPARGGSRGVPRKNVRLLAGKPLIVWAIEEAKLSKRLTRTVVSTEDEEIAAIARSCGGEVPFLRPMELAKDMSTDIEFIEHALAELRRLENYIPEIIVRLPPTSPLRIAEDIDTGIGTLLADDGADSARPVIEAPKHPYKTWKIQEGGKYLEPFFSKDVTGFDEPHNLPRQLFPKAYIHTGAMDVIRRGTIEKLHSTSGRRVAFFFMPEERSVNIDTLPDFEFAEFLMKKRLALS